MQKIISLLCILSFLALTSCRTSCGCPMAEVELSADPIQLEIDA